MSFDTFRQDGLPTYYNPNQTPVTEDVLVVGFVFAFVIIAFSFFILIPGIKGWQRFFFFCRVTISLFIGASVTLSNFGQSWEISFISNVTTAYRAGRSGDMQADIGVNIGLRAVNITLKGVPEFQDGDSAAAGERVNYNERFHLGGSQGRTGFGRYAGRINRDFREAQYRGLPYPILWIAEYFVLDGEDIRWGRSYRLAGFYAALLIWLSFPLWLLTNILLTMGTLSEGFSMLLLTGGCMLGANIMYASIRYGSQLFIPFSAHHILYFSYGWSFYLCLVAGLVAVILAIGCHVLHIFFPGELEEFFGLKEEFNQNDLEFHVRPRSAKTLKENTVKRLDNNIIVKRSRRTRRMTVFRATARPHDKVAWE
ncbi:dual oxidase maturation factor 1-like isoform X1 [Lytechinus pictus]|uniref:dual oxidase maturation factor 1-like isoform X1 n=1 Tax=Lytechinus pictus TaxID=7653 RepID=UPI0030BA26FD